MDLDHIWAIVRAGIGFLLTIGILVSVHEWGHFWVARRLGIKVLRFAVGFGKPLYTRTGSDGVAYILGSIPLGGYVAILGEGDEQVPASERHLTFQAQPIWKRMAVIAAGPMANLVLAVVLFWGLLILGVPGVKPIFGEPIAGSPAAIAGYQYGDEIIAIDQKKTPSLERMIEPFVDGLSQSGRVELSILRQGIPMQLTLDLATPLQLDQHTDLLKEVGLTSPVPASAPKVAQVMVGRPAEQAGVQVGDRLIAINGVATPTIEQFLAHMQSVNPDQVVRLSVQRVDQVQDIFIHAERNQQGHAQIGIAVNGVQTPEMEAMRRQLHTIDRAGVGEALYQAVLRTGHGVVFTLRTFVRIVTGQYSFKMLSGPITIADYAGQALESGWVRFIGLVAMISINIGVINLVPIPVLDGGRLVGLMAEGLLGRGRIPASLGAFIMKLGVLMLFAFMSLAIFNDLSRWF